MTNRLKDKEITYSEPVREVMGQVPSWILRWGNTLIFIVFIILILFSWLIKYPDRIPAPVEITTVNPPVTMVSKITGRIKDLYVNDKEIVDAGKLIAVMETAASIEEIRLLEEITDTVSNPDKISLDALPRFSELGEIQSFWSKFLTSLSDYNNYLINDYYGNKIVSVKYEIESIQNFINRLKVKEQLYLENQILESRKFIRDSLLRINGVFSESELEKSKQSLIKMKIDLQQVRLDHSEKSIELAEKNQMLQDFKIKKQEEKERYLTSLNESFLNLKAQINIWKNTYLIVSPVTGTVSFTKFWSENQTVTKDEPVISIIPVESGDFIGRIFLKMNRSGKVRIGQTVNIKFSGYPFLEFGMVRGIVKSKSLVPSGDAYVIELTLPDGLVTLYGKKLDFNQNMQGTAEIITDNLRLLEKIINPFRYLISRNKS